MTRHAIESAWLLSFLLSVPGLAAGPSGVDKGRWQWIKDDVELADYRITRADAQSYQAVNRARGLVASFRGDGVVRPEGAGPGGWEWGVSLAGHGAEGALSIAENRVEIVREPLTEWYVNSPEGLVHGFTISSPPPDRHRGDLVLDLKVTGTLRPIFVSGGKAVDFFGAGSVSVLRHGALTATDAMGRNATARFEPIPGGVRIVVDDERAVYPITIESVATSAG